MDGLARAVDGGSAEGDGARRYLGWTANGTHWLIPREPSDGTAAR